MGGGFHTRLRRDSTSRSGCREPGGSAATERQGTGTFPERAAFKNINLSVGKGERPQPRLKRRRKKWGGGEIVTRTPRKPRKAKPAVSCPLPATTRRSACPLRAPPPPHRGASARASRQRRARPSRRRPRRPASPPDGAALGAGAGRGAGRGAGAAPRRALAPRPGRCLSAAMSGGARRRGGLGRRRPL